MEPVLLIDVEGDEVIVTGPRDRVRSSLDLSLLNYVEIDGFIQTQMHDPVPHAGRMAANGAVRMARGKAS